MLIFKEDSRTGVSCGLNDFGELFHRQLPLRLQSA